MIVDKTRKIVTIPSKRNKVDRASWILFAKAVPRGCLVEKKAFFGSFFEIDEVFFEKIIPISNPLNTWETKIINPSFWFPKSRLPISPKMNRGLE